jgi:hypothetical protein
MNQYTEDDVESILVRASQGMYQIPSMRVRYAIPFQSTTITSLTPATCGSIGTLGVANLGATGFYQSPCQVAAQQLQTIAQPQNQPKYQFQFQPQYQPFLSNLQGGPNQYQFGMQYDQNLLIQKRAVKYFYIKTIDKWLYNDDEFECLLKYFKVKKADGEAHISLMTSSELSKRHDDHVQLDDEDKNLVFQFIEVFFVNKKMIYSILKNFVKDNYITWLDLYHNSTVIKGVIRHKLKKRIIRTIFEIDHKVDLKE